MILADVRKVVQPELDQDFDALFEEFVEESSSEDITEFLHHLHDYGLISEELIQQIVSESTLAHPTDEPSEIPPIDWQGDAPVDEFDEEEATVLRKVSDLMEMTKAAQSTHHTSPSPQSFTPPLSPPPVQTPAKPQPEEASTGMEFMPSFGDDAPAEKKGRRTSFRKRSDGHLQETGPFAKPKRRQRRRTPSPKHRHDETRYKLLGQVGEGAMGQVLLAQDKILHRKIAYKEMSDDIAHQAALASKFSAEAQITAQLEHPNIVPVYALEGETSYTMKLIKGKTVEDLLKETQNLLRTRTPLDEDHSLESRLDLFLKVCDAIAFANARGVVHRDLKPENIMLGEFGEVYVMDWGIAHLMKGDYGDPITVQAIEDEGDLIIGTAGYMSPEQADARTAELTGASDQYALGLILFELISLRPAVTGKNAMHIITRHQEGELDRLVHATREKIAPELAAIVKKATSLDPKRRYPTVDDLGDDIRRYLRNEAVLAKPDNPWQALVRFTGRHRQATLLTGMALAFAGILFIMVGGIYAQLTVSRAATREQAVSNLVTTIGRQASLIEGRMVYLKGLLLILSTTAEDMLTIGEPSAQHLYTSLDYEDPSRRPADTRKSSVYKEDISLQHSAFLIPPNAPNSVRESLLPRLLPMERHYQKVLLRSHSEAAAQYTPKRAARALSQVGVPIAWAYIALAEGAYSVYPGHGGYSTDFDPRKNDWYRRAARAEGPVWSPPMTDDDSTEKKIVVPCSIPLKNAQGDLLGVAGIDINYSYITEELMGIDSLDNTGAKSYIVDRDGRILMDNTGSPLDRRMFPDETVVTAIKANRSGVHESGSNVTVYTRLVSLDWFYVVVGPSNAMLSAVGQQ